VDKSETSILDNIKDINLLSKDMSEAKNDIEELKKRLSNLGNNGSKGD
jgi:polyhydroxyalkanoate synthesis regulator phasin